MRPLQRETPQVPAFQFLFTFPYMVYCVMCKFSPVVNRLLSRLLDYSVVEQAACGRMHFTSEGVVHLIPWPST